MTDQEEFARLWYQSMMEKNGCGTPLYIAIIIGIVFLFCSCATKQSTEYTEKHKMEKLIEKMDSLVSKSEVTSSDSTLHSTFIRELQSIREHNDTSHYVVVDTAGNVVKEKIVINNTKEVTSEKDREQLIMMSHRLEIMDSTLCAMKTHVERSDSLLSASKKETVKEVVKFPKSYWWFVGISIISFIFAFVKLLRWLRII